MYKIYCLNNISPEGLALLTDNYEVTENIDEADAILVRSADMHEMEVPANLKAVARAGAGVNNIPLDRAADAGIVVFNTPGANANGVKELVFAGMLLASRDIVGGIQWVKENSGEAEAFTDNVIMYEFLSELKDIAARPNGITCGCGSHDYSMEIRRDAVELTCRDCGARLRLYFFSVQPNGCGV